MKISQYIIVKKVGYRYSSRLTKNDPNLEAGEIAIKVKLEIPDAIFITPTLEANIIVPEEAVSQPIIEAEVIDNIEKIIKDNTGFAVRLEAAVKEEE